MSQKKIEEINAIQQAKSDYIASMSHGLKTPLVAIVGIGEILKNELKDSKYQALLTDLENASNTILSLVKDILGLTRIETGHLELLFEPFDLLKLIEGVVSTLSHQCLEKGVELLISYPPSLPKILISDSSAIRRIIINLLSTAIKFTDAGHIIIKVSIQQLTEKEANLNISVEDTGIGIPEHCINETFDESGLLVEETNQYKSANLSIFIVKQLVNGLGGKVELKNTPNKGTKFNCLLPFARPKLSSQSSKWEEKYQALKILIVSDYPLSSEIIASLLATNQPTVCSSTECFALLQKAYNKNEPYQIIVVEDKLLNPALLSVAAQTEQWAQKALCVYISFPLNLTQIEQVRLRGFQEIMHKPVLPNQFIEQLYLAWERHLKNESSSNTTFNVANKLETFNLVMADHTQVTEQKKPSSNHQVLLVEDNLVVSKITKILLEKLDCEVDTASNGEEALLLSNAKIYDLIFLDIDLPDIDGISICRTIRTRSGPNQFSTIVALTGQIVEKEAKVCLAAGMNAFLEKPATSSDFNRLIREFLLKEQPSI